MLILALLLTASAHTGIKKPAAKMHVVKNAPAIICMDASKIDIKKFSADSLNKFRADKDFNYNDYAGAGEMSLWSRFWHWVWDKLFGSIFRLRYAGVIFEYGVGAAGVMLLIFVISKSLGIDPIQLLRGNSKKTDVPYTESAEDIHGIDFDAEIEKAIAQSNYRLAVRLLYLRCLKSLSDTQLIHWQIDKTNSDYLNELTDPSQKQNFSLITRQFEYVWYGNFTIDKQSFNHISQLFKNFKTLLP